MSVRRPLSGHVFFGQLEDILKCSEEGGGKRANCPRAMRSRVPMKKMNSISGTELIKSSKSMPQTEKSLTILQEMTTKDFLKCIFN